MKAALLALPLLLAATAAPGPSLQPGQWRSIVTVLDAQAAAAPAVAASMKGRKTVLNSCLTAAQAPHGLHLLFSGGKAQCRFTNFTVAGNHLSSNMVCTGPSGTTNTRSTGSFTATSFDVTGTATTSGAIRMTVKTRTVGQRTGGC